MPTNASSTKLNSSRRLAKSVNNQNPTANPTNANAAHGKIGNSHTCGRSKMCTPFTYDSTCHGKNRGRHVVHSAGVAIATAAAATNAKTRFRARTATAVAEPKPPTAQHSAPIKIIEIPRIFSTSTRNKSVHGEIGIPKINSCKRKKIPNPNTSAPRRITRFAIAPRVTPFARNFSVTSATEIPAKKINNGAGSVPPICEYR